MVVSSHVPAPGVTDHALPLSVARPPWLLLADEALEPMPGTDLPAGSLVIADPAIFRTILLAERPRVVVCSSPPADRDLVALVAAERRRRTLMRAVHISSPAAIAERLAALEAGFDEALPASTPVAELLGRLTWLDARSRARQPSAGVLPIADGLTLDTVARVLRRGTAIVHLRPKEYGLLAMLAAHPGRAYSREQLLGLVWGQRRSESTRTVDVHVRWLRSKIEPEPDQPVHLVTVRGVGYRLDPEAR